MEEICVFAGSYPKELDVLRKAIYVWEEFGYGNTKIGVVGGEVRTEIVKTDNDGKLKIRRSYTKHFDKDGQFRCTMVNNDQLQPGYKAHRYCTNCQTTLSGCHEHDENCDSDCSKYCDCPEYPKDYILRIYYCKDDKDFYQLTIEERFI